METTKKTSTTKAALLVLAALSMLLSGLFIATASSSDAQDASCPAGFTLSADGTNCSQPSAVTTLDLGNTCATGFLSPSGTNCWIAATSTDQGGSTACPAGFSANALGVCAASASATATVSADTCAAGASGTPATGCYTTVAQTTTAASCTLPGGSTTSTVDGTNCLQTNPAGTTNVCTNGGVVDATYNDEAGSVVADCFSTSVEGGLGCTLPALVGGAVGALGADVTLCYLPGTVTVGTGLACPAGQIVQATNCVFYDVTQYNVATSACPAGTTLDAGGVTCSASAGVVAGTTTYTCAAGTLTVTDATPAVATCDTTSGFEATPGGVLYMCEAGTPAVVGTAVLCDLGAATSGVTTGPSCAQGVLSADAASCVVAAASAVAAPVPAFTG